MELYLFVVVVLFGLAISDLVVGVSNDAVNFLNSAIGSHVAPRWFIMIVASAGIMLGVLFSSGMMEVARKGIFNPHFFVMTELLFIFLAVMITDVILLDMYNSLGLPTSTTVSIVFELLGAAVAISLIKIIHAGEGMQEIVNYINTAKALAIITGILSSIVVSFTVGAIFQFFTRLIFTFEFEKRMKRYGALWAGFALSLITYFILLKGANGASFLSKETITWLATHTLVIMSLSFVVWAVIFQFLLLFTKINILKPIVLIGTGALAMSFAANDLVNFIGVPLAGYHTFLIAKGFPDPLQAEMGGLAGEVSTPVWMLLIAGAVMVLTLWVSKKAQAVTKTEVGLGRQDEDGEERFQPSVLSRAIVQMSISVARFFGKISPNILKDSINNRFVLVNTTVSKKGKKEKPAFDLLRASTNLVVASALISFATSLKLPLSTTYVTFMVAMGSSFSDRSWGRDSAVYRISGVLTVIGGWFFTAFLAFTVSLIFAVLIYFFRLPAIIILVFLAIYFVASTHFLHHKKAKESEAEEIEFDTTETNQTTAYEKLVKSLDIFFNRVEKNIDDVFTGVFKQKKELLKKALKDSKKVEKNANKIIARLFTVLQMQSSENELDINPALFGALRETSRHLRVLSETCLDHVLNQHSSLTEIQIDELKTVKAGLTKLIDKVSRTSFANDKKLYDPILLNSQELKSIITEMNKNQLKRIKKGNIKTRRSMLYLGILTQTEDLVDQIVELVKGLGDTTIVKK